MFLGHFAVAFAAKRVASRASLGTLVFAAQFLDLIWPILVLLGVERVRIDPGNTRMTPLAFESYPISQSLVLALLWSGVIATVHRMRSRSARAALVVGAAVFSHWVLDWLTHRPDLQLVPGAETRAGLGLWNNPPLTVAIESCMFLLAVASYVIQTRPRDAIGRFGLSAFIIFLTVVYALNLTSPPPPSSQIVAASALALWLLVPWAAWVDRHREPRSHVR
jgi:membrane-bound metal-dependent hydrolase YbcI (DUF457 family)